MIYKLLQVESRDTYYIYSITVLDYNLKYLYST